MWGKECEKRGLCKGGGWRGKGWGDERRVSEGRVRSGQGTLSVVEVVSDKGVEIELPYVSPVIPCTS